MPLPLISVLHNEKRRHTVHIVAENIQSFERNEELKTLVVNLNGGRQHIFEKEVAADGYAQLMAVFAPTAVVPVATEPVEPKPAEPAKPAKK